MHDQLKTRFNLTDEQIAALLLKVKPEVVEQALKLTKFDNVTIFKQNIVIAHKMYFQPVKTD